MGRFVDSPRKKALLGWEMAHSRDYSATGGAFATTLAG